MNDNENVDIKNEIDNRIAIMIRKDILKVMRKECEGYSMKNIRLK